MDEAIISDLGCVWSVRAYDDMLADHRPQLPRNTTVMIIMAHAYDNNGSNDEQIDHIANYDL